MRFLERFNAMLRASRSAVARIPIVAKCRCNICDQQVRRFLPYRGGSAGLPPLIRQLGVVGSDVENHECPACGCHDRERHLLMYLQASGLMPKMKGTKILHLAPERHLQRFIESTMPEIYIQGDLYPARPNIEKIDLQCVPYPDKYFDFVIANHILEHVQNDLEALSEIFRVLRNGGYAILQTPFSKVLTQIFEDPGIQSPAARLQAYGQEDHCRLYGQNIFQRFEIPGFRSLAINHLDVFSKTDSIKYGVNSNEPFFLFQKPS